MNDLYIYILSTYIIVILVIIKNNYYNIIIIQLLLLGRDSGGTKIVLSVYTLGIPKILPMPK